MTTSLLNIIIFSASDWLISSRPIRELLLLLLFYLTLCKCSKLIRSQQLLRPQLIFSSFASTQL